MSTRQLPKSRPGPLALGLCAFIFSALSWSCGGGDGDAVPDAGGDTGGESPCPWDEDSEPDAANALELGTAAEGYICPRGDHDWYRFTVPDDLDLVTVEVALDAMATPIDPSYSIWKPNGEKPLLTPLSSESAAPSKPLAVTHGLGPGKYRLMVRDRGDDAEDVRHPYRVTVTGGEDPDSLEPNNDDGDATGMGDTPEEGYISYRGDEDWFAVTSSERGLLSVTLTMPAGGIEPRFRVIDPEGTELVSQVNEAGKREETSLTYLQSLDLAGVYHVVVSDDDDTDSDAETAYTLETSVMADPDENEPNDTADEATANGASVCDPAWSDWTEATGYLGSSGDADWFSVDLTGCERGVIEAEVAFEDPKSLPDDLEPTIRFVYEVAEEPCSVDQDCQELTRSCTTDLDCARVGSTCLGTGRCAGASVCFGGESCGATLISRVAARRGRAEVAAPLFGQTRMYVVIEDFHSDAHSMDNAYTLRTRTREDPDPREPSEAYTAGPPDTEHEASAHAAHATEVPVHDCTGESDGGVDCCGPDTWVEGALSYTFDQDWFSYNHPCPGEDCMVRVVYELGAGPVDFYMMVVTGDAVWFDNLTDTVDMADQPASSGGFGGLDASDYCFYAYQGHGGDPYQYRLAIRDMIYVGEGQEEDGTWDWSPDQSYRFCVEKISAGCHSPCQDYDGECGVPSE